MMNFQGTFIEEPPANKEILPDNGWTHTVLDQQTQAWPLYLAYVAHSLAAEIGAWAPWSLKAYDGSDLQLLLSSWNMHHYDSNVPNDVYNTNYPGYVVYGSNATPAHPTFSYLFLHNNNLIDSTTLQTVVKVLEWSRWNMTHYIGGYSPKNLEYHWQYRGHPPASRVIQGTVITDPAYSSAYLCLKFIEARDC